MATYVTSDGSLYQERIAEVLARLGVQRFNGQSTELQAHNAVVVQGINFPQQLATVEQASKPLVFIAWLPAYDGLVRTTTAWTYVSTAPLWWPRQKRPRNG